MSATLTLKFIGPEGQVCPALAEDQAVEHGREYELDRETAIAIVNSSQMWEPTGPGWPAVDGADDAPETLTVKQMDELYGDVEGYPAKGKRDVKAAWVVEHLANLAPEPDELEAAAAADNATGGETAQEV